MHELRLYYDGICYTFKPGDIVEIGRSPGNTVVIADPAVSRRHAQLGWEDETRWVWRNVGQASTFYGDSAVEVFEVTQHLDVSLASPQGPVVRLVPAPESQFQSELSRIWRSRPGASADLAGDRQDSWPAGQASDVFANGAYKNSGHNETFTRNQQPAETCDESQHWSEQVRITCPRCHSVIIFSAVPRIAGKIQRWPIAVLLLSYMFALFLGRHPNAFWPAYILLSLTVINLFAIVFSKGAVLRQVALGTMFAVLGWAIWWQGILRPAVGSRIWHSMPILLWVVAVLYAFWLGRQVNEHLRIHRVFGTLFLVMAAFIFGMWAIVAVGVQYGYGYTWISAFALPLLAIAPLVTIIVDVSRPEASSLNTRLKDGSITISAILVALSAFLTVLQIAGDLLVRVQRELPWRILALPALHQFSPAWFTLSSWKTVISAVASAIALVLLFAKSLQTTLQQPQPAGWYALRAQISESDRRLITSTGQVSSVSGNISIAVLKVVLALYQIVTFSGRLVWYFSAALGPVIARSAIAVIKAARLLVLPLICFSISSLLLMAVLGDLVRYELHLRQAYSAISLWGGLVSASTLIFAFSAISFGLNPMERYSMWPLQPPTLRTFFIRSATSRLSSRFSWLSSALSIRGAGFEPALLIGFSFGVVIAFLSIMLWIIGAALERVGVHVTELDYGSLQLIILLSVVVFAIVVAIPVLPTVSFSQNSLKRDPDPSLIFGGLISAVVIVTVSALAFGYGPLFHWIGLLV